jgi:hypothetical protein
VRPNEFLRKVNGTEHRGPPDNVLAEFSTMVDVGTRLPGENATTFGDVDFGMGRSVSDGRVKTGNGRALG